MTAILGMIYSGPAFLLGGVVTLMLQHLYWRQQRLYLDKHYPLPDGAKHAVRRISRTWLAAAAAVLSLGYVLFTATVTHDQTIRLTQDVAKCWQQSYQSTRAQIELNAQNDLISRTQQSLQREFDVDTSNWIKDLIAPPGDLADQDINSTARKAWGLQVTTKYQAQLDDLGARFDDQVHQRTVLDEKRDKHPLPEVTCGK